MLPRLFISKPTASTTAASGRESQVAGTFVTRVSEKCGKQSIRLFRAALGADDVVTIIVYGLEGLEYLTAFLALVFIYGHLFLLNNTILVYFTPVLAVPDVIFVAFDYLTSSSDIL
jgi:hypothetical protein